MLTHQPVDERTVSYIEPFRSRSLRRKAAVGLRPFDSILQVTRCAVLQ